MIEYTQEQLNDAVGKRVKKVGGLGGGKGKPFKSKYEINTIKGVIDHPVLHIPAFTFVEDDSFVECRRCEIIN